MEIVVARRRMDAASSLRAALAGGVAGGTIDIAYAILANGAKGITPTVVLQSVASGVMGRAAYQGGMRTAVIGGILHFAMTIAMALIFITVARSVAPVRQQLLLSGMIYGAIIYFAMRWVVVPISRFPGDLRSVNALELAVHMIGVGVVIALFAKRFEAVPPRDPPAQREATFLGEEM